MDEKIRRGFRQTETGHWVRTDEWLAARQDQLKAKKSELILRLDHIDQQIGQCGQTNHFVWSGRLPWALRLRLIWRILVRGTLHG